MRTKNVALALVVAALAFAPAARAYKLIGAAWDADKGPVVYHLEPSGSADIDDGSDLQAVRDAFHRWACVEGSKLRFIEGAEPGVKNAALDDGINSVFWDEDGSFGLGPGTLGVNIGSAPTSPDEPIIRDASDIVFNGFDYEWSTDDNASAIDVGSIAIHETGHWLGLDHPCTDPQETDCLGPDEAVMTPAYAGGLVRDPRPDDIAGVVEMYPANDESRCDGPFRQGEVCTCNEDCVAGLLCIEAPNGSQVCAPKCSSEDTSCPGGFACVLGAAPTNGDPAGGTCIPVVAGGLKPAAAVCERDSECGVGLCLATPAIGRTVCKKSCDEDSDCPANGYRCVDEVCVGAGASEGIMCPVEDEAPACGCDATGADQASALWGSFALLGLLGLTLRRRR